MRKTNPAPTGRTTGSVTAEAASGPLQLAAQFDVPVIECPRKPVDLPFCFLLPDGSERWLMLGVSVIGEHQTHACAAMARMMERCRDNQRQMALLYGRNAVQGTETGVVSYLLFFDNGSAVRSAQYHTYWQDPAWLCRKYRVPGPDVLPDADLEPLVARNRVLLLPPTLPYCNDDPRSVFWSGYGKIPGWSPLGTGTGSGLSDEDEAEAQLKQAARDRKAAEKQQAEAARAAERDAADRRRRQEREERLVAQELKRAATARERELRRQEKAAQKSGGLPSLPKLPTLPSLPKLPGE